MQNAARQVIGVLRRPCQTALDGPGQRAHAQIGGLQHGGKEQNDGQHHQDPRAAVRQRIDDVQRRRYRFMHPDRGTGAGGHGQHEKNAHQSWHDQQRALGRSRPRVRQGVAAAVGHIARRIDTKSRDQHRLRRNPQHAGAQSDLVRQDV